MVDATHAKYANWVTAGFSIAILLARLALSRHTIHATALCRVLCVLSILVIVSRIPIIYIVLRYGTVANALGTNATKQAVDLHKIKIGSILTLVARSLATSFYWLQTAILLQFYTRVIGHIDWCCKAIKWCWVAIVITYVACVLTTFLECQPFNLYWQLYPSVDQCTRAYVQMFTQGSLNIVLDIMLLVISIPLWTGQKFTISQTLRISVLLLTGTFCIIITAIKLNFVVGSNSHQRTRTFWASIQILVSTFVANAPVIYGSIRNVIRRKEEKKTRRASRPDDWAGLSVARTRTHEDRFQGAERVIRFESGSTSTDKVDIEHHEFAP